MFARLFEQFNCTLSSYVTVMLLQITGCCNKLGGLKQKCIRTQVHTPGASPATFPRRAPAEGPLPPLPASGGTGVPQPASTSLHSLPPSLLRRPHMAFLCGAPHVSNLPAFSYRDTCLRVQEPPTTQDELVPRSLITSSRTRFPTKVRFTGPWSQDLGAS